MFGVEGHTGDGFYTIMGNNGEPHELSSKLFKGLI